MERGKDCISDDVFTGIVNANDANDATKSLVVVDVDMDDDDGDVDNELDECDDDDRLDLVR